MVPLDCASQRLGPGTQAPGQAYVRAGMCRPGLACPLAQPLVDGARVARTCAKRGTHFLARASSARHSLPRHTHACACASVAKRMQGGGRSAGAAAAPRAEPPADAPCWCIPPAGAFPPVRRQAARIEKGKAERAEEEAPRERAGGTLACTAPGTSAPRVAEGSAAASAGEVRACASTTHRPEGRHTRSSVTCGVARARDEMGGSLCGS